MGIIRRTVHSLGKPVFRGDVRDGIIIFDPLAEEVEKVKLTLKDFILGYDENNQASEFTTLNFYFSREQFVIKNNGNRMQGLTDSSKIIVVKPLDEDEIPSGEMKILIKTTNVFPKAQLMKPLTDYLDSYTKFKITFEKTSLIPSDFTKAKVLMILAEEEEMNFLEEQEKLTADFIRSGGFIIADMFATSPQNKNWGNINNFINNVGVLLGNKFDMRRLPSSHPLYSVWKKMETLPQIDSDLFNLQEKLGGQSKDRMYDYLIGCFYENRLVGVISNRGYSISWGEFFSPEYKIGKNYTRQRELLANILYYAYESTKHVK